MSVTDSLPIEVVDADCDTWLRDPTGDVYGCAARQQWGLTLDEIEQTYGLWLSDAQHAAEAGGRVAVS